MGTKFEVDNTGNINKAKSIKLDAIAAPTAAAGLMYFDSGDNKLKVSNNGSTFDDVASSTFINITGTSATADRNKNYLSNNSSLVTFTLGSNYAIGDTLNIIGVNTGGWTIAANSYAWAETTDTAGSGWSSASSQTPKAGIVVLTGTAPCLLTKLTKSASCSATKAYIYRSAGDGTTAGLVLQGASVSFVGNDATFNIKLEPNTQYWLLVDNSGSAYAHGYTDGTGGITKGKYLTITHGHFGGNNQFQRAEVTSVSTKGLSFTNIASNAPGDRIKLICVEATPTFIIDSFKGNPTFT